MILDSLNIEEKIGLRNEIRKIIVNHQTQIDFDIAKASTAQLKE